MYRLDVVLVCNYPRRFFLFVFLLLHRQGPLQPFSVYATVRLPTVAKGLEETENFLAMQVSLFFLFLLILDYMCCFYIQFFSD